MNCPKNYYPTYHHGCNPLHPVRDWSKVRKLIRDGRRGDKIPPIIIDGPMRGGNMINGTHRSAANDILAMQGKRPLIDVISLEDMDLSPEQQNAIESGEASEMDFWFDRIND